MLTKGLFWFLGAIGKPCISMKEKVELFGGQDEQCSSPGRIVVHDGNIVMERSNVQCARRLQHSVGIPL